MITGGRNHSRLVLTQAGGRGILCLDKSDRMMFSLFLDLSTNQVLPEHRRGTLMDHLWALDGPTSILWPPRESSHRNGRQKEDGRRCRAKHLRSYLLTWSRTVAKSFTSSQLYRHAISPQLEALQSKTGSLLNLTAKVNKNGAIFSVEELQLNWEGVRSCTTAAEAGL